MSDVATGGGHSVGGNVSAGGDFTGRDKYNVGDGATAGNRVEIHTGPERFLRRDDDSSDRDILKRIDQALRGNPYDARDRGLLHDFARLTENVSVMMSQQTKATDESERLGSRVSFLSTSTMIIAIVLFLVVVIVAGIVVYLGQQRLVSEPPAASVEYPHKAAVEGKSAVDEQGNYPVRYNANAEAGYRDADGRKQRAVGVTGLARMFGEPFPVFVPNPEVEQIAQGQPQRDYV